MIILSIINFFKGYVKIKISGRHTERFINICAKKNIYIWNIKRKSQSELEAYVSSEAFKLLGDVSVSADVEVTELMRGGFSVIAKKMMGRSGIIVGFIIVALLFFWMSSRVWYIEIAPSNISEEVLREQLKQSGLDIGVKISDLDTRKLQAQMMNLNQDIEWIWTKKNGTKIFVDLRERVKRPVTIDINQPCNLVATHAGKVTFAMITEGRAMVTVGQTVSEGQLLAGGMLKSAVVGARGVHSQGTVMADVFITKSGEYALSAEENIPTGKENKNYILKLGKREIQLPSLNKNFGQQVIMTETFPLKIGDIYFPVSLIKNTAVETITRTVNLNRDDVIKDAEKYLDGLLQKEVGSGTIIERYFFVEDIDENTLRVRLEALCNIEIAKKQAIGEEKSGG